MNKERILASLERIQKLNLRIDGHKELSLMSSELGGARCVATE